MTDLDVDSARKAGVAVPPASASEYAEAADQLQPGFVATVDGTDPSIGWTVQHRNADRVLADSPDGKAKPAGKNAVKEFTEPGDTLPGQVYTPDQLPDPQAAIQAGMAPVKIPEHLITENPNHIQGPEPWERLILEAREKLRRGVVRHRDGSAYAGISEDDDDGVPAEDASVGAGQGT